MLSVRLCCLGGLAIVFSLLSARSVTEMHNIIASGTEARLVGDPKRLGRADRLQLHVADGRYAVETLPRTGVASDGSMMAGLVPVTPHRRADRTSL